MPSQKQYYVNFSIECEKCFRTRIIDDDNERFEIIQRISIHIGRNKLLPSCDTMIVAILPLVETTTSARKCWMVFSMHLLVHLAIVESLIDRAYLFSLLLPIHLFSFHFTSFLFSSPLSLSLSFSISIFFCSNLLYLSTHL